MLLDGNKSKLPLAVARAGLGLWASGGLILSLKGSLKGDTDMGIGIDAIGIDMDID